MEGMIFRRDPERAPGDFGGHGLLRVLDPYRGGNSYPTTLGVTAPRIEMRWDSYPRAGRHSPPYCRAILFQNDVAVSPGPE
eukprot:2356402-Heterocapsa_arctica.AAC.1